MNTLSKDELKRLAEEQAGLCVSIFMPAHRVGPETQQDPIRFRNLLRDAEERLIAEGLRVPDARKLLTPAQKLLADGFFWRHLSDGLALFLSPNVFRYYVCRSLSRNVWSSHLVSTSSRSCLCSATMAGFTFWL